MQTKVRAIDDELATSITSLDALRTQLTYWRQEELAVLPGFVPASLVDAIAAEIHALDRRVVRRHVPGYKNAGSIGSYWLREHAPTAVALYQSPTLRRFLSDLAGMELVTCPDDDPHACAVYCYERAGDRIGFHYDTSWYRGARYTVLVGLIDESSARLHCQVHARDRHRPTKDLRVETAPGTTVFFNGDKLRHAVTPLGDGERRVVLTLQYVTDPRMDGWRRVVSKLKDSLTYFGMVAFRSSTPTASDSPTDPRTDP